MATDSQQFDHKSFLRDFEEEKRWMRSQLIPLNYLFEKLKTVEDSFTKLQVMPTEYNVISITTSKSIKSKRNATVLLYRAMLTFAFIAYVLDHINTISGSIVQT